MALLFNLHCNRCNRIPNLLAVNRLILTITENFQIDFNKLQRQSTKILDGLQPMGALAPIQAALLTDRGIVRDHNEDYFLHWEPDNLQDEAKNGWLYIVADGVGGADAGEVASQFASERTQLHYLTNETETHLGERLRQAMHVANTDLRQLVSERDGTKRMGNNDGLLQPYKITRPTYPTWAIVEGIIGVRALSGR